MTGNPLIRLSRWLGWTQNQYLRFGGWLLTLVAFGAAVGLSYSSLYYIATRALGFDPAIAWCFPLTIDAMVGASYITLWQLAAIHGPAGRGVDFWYVLGMGLVAAALTVSGNALHGPIEHGQLPNPLPWWAQMIGSAVPALTLVGAGHSMYIMLAVRRRERANEPAGEESAPAPEPVASESATSPAPLPTPAPAAAAPFSEAPAVSELPERYGERGSATGRTDPEAVAAAIRELESTGRPVTGSTLGELLNVSARTARRYLPREHRRPAAASTRGGERASLAA